MLRELRPDAATPHRPQPPQSTGRRLQRPDWPDIEPAPPVEYVRVHFEDGQSYIGPPGTLAESFAWRALQERQEFVLPIAVLLDGRLRELTTPIERETTAQIVDMAHPDGTRIYRRSLTLLLLAAVERLFSGAQTSVEHSLPFGAYYCTFSNRDPLSAQELASLEAEMWRMVDEDLPINRRRVPHEEVMDFFQSSGDESKVNLLAHWDREDLELYTLDRVHNFFHGHMAPSTGYLRWFGLDPYGAGFLLRFPQSAEPTKLQPIQPAGALVAVFHEYRDWMSKMDLHNLGSLNNAAVAGKIGELILISEALHERRIAEIASTVAASWNEATATGKKIRVVLIAGPSSSGKTTFSKRLGVQLLANGIRPYAVSLDNYFVDRAVTPRLDSGEYDFESIRAINLSLLNKQLVDLLDGQEVVLPYYDFVTGRSEIGETVRLEPNQVLIIEGIHGLNPELTTAIPEDSTLRVYVSVVAHLNLDQHNRISTSDVRLLRRITRDHNHRGYTAAETILRWEHVRLGERRYIFPYQGNAHVVFNSALVYDLCVLKPIVEPLLLQIEWDTPAYVEARRLLAFLRWVRPVEADLVPDNSIIREFIGGSILRRLSLL
jgi:uridine kinase